jgi:hypothetical protein
MNNSLEEGRRRLGSSRTVQTRGGKSDIPYLYMYFLVVLNVIDLIHRVLYPSCCRVGLGWLYLGQGELIRGSGIFTFTANIRNTLEKLRS